MDIEKFRELAMKAKPGYMLSQESENANFAFICACDPQTIIALIEDNDRLRRCINMAMGCLDPMSADRDVKLAWFRLFDAMEGKEPRARLAQHEDAKR